MKTLSSTIILTTNLGKVYAEFSKKYVKYKMVCFGFTALLISCFVDDYVDEGDLRNIQSEIIHYYYYGDKVPPPFGENHRQEVIQKAQYYSKG